MLKLQHVLLSGTVAVMSLPSQAAPAQVKMPSQNGRVVYRMNNSGAMKMAGTVTMAWTDFGRKFRQDSTLQINMGQRPTQIKTWALYQNGAMYMVAPGPSSGGRRRVMKMKMPQNPLTQLASGAWPGTSGVQVDKGRVMGRANILGKPCDIRVATAKAPGVTTQAKMWMWQNLPLRTEISMIPKPAQGQNRARSMPPMKISLLATKLETNAKLSSALFQLPSNIEVRDMGDMSQMMRQRRR